MQQILDCLERLEFLNRKSRFLPDITATINNVISGIKADLKGKVLVDEKALQELLVAVNGPGHYIRELQIIENLPGSEHPIKKLTEQLKAQCSNGT